MIGMGPLTDPRDNPADARRTTTRHSVVKVTVTHAGKICPVFETGDFFYVRQHIVDTEVSSIRNFCYHTLASLHEVFVRVRGGQVGASEVFRCRDKATVEFLVERLADEQATIGRGVVSNPKPYAPPRR